MSSSYSNKINSVVSYNNQTSANELEVKSYSFASTKNSTTETLNIGATFTGQWEDCKDFSDITISVLSDKASASEGLIIDWSNNGSTIIYSGSHSVSANTSKTIVPIILERYFRIRYTNGSVAQTSFSLSTILRKASPSWMFRDEDGVPYGVKHINNKPRVSSMPYLYDIAEGNVPEHNKWNKIGYSPSQTPGVNTDIWSYSGTQPVYVYPTAAMQMEVLSSNNVDDIATVIHSGTSTGGSTTTLISEGENFLTTTVAGDQVILDKSGASPAWGYITSVDSDTQITCSGGFSDGGTGSGRAYNIIDKSAKNGATSVRIEYLDGNYAQKQEIILLNGTTVVATVNTDIFRINSFRVITAGVNNIPTGNIFIRNLADTPVYSYITAGFNRARNIIYTVPAGLSLYVVKIEGGYATTGNANKEYARITTRANVDPSTAFHTDGLFYPFTDTQSQNTTINTDLPMPTMLSEKTDIRMSGIVTATGSITVTLRGWLENN